MAFHDMEAMQAYEDAFEDSSISIEEPGDCIIITDHINSKTYDLPENETKRTFYDRIRRSKECGRNLFYEECPPYDREWMYDPTIEA